MKRKARQMIHVYELPEKLASGKFLFGTQGEDVNFKCVDWFQSRCELDISPQFDLAEFIRDKKYRNPSKSYLVLDTNGNDTMVIAPTK